MRWRLDEPNTRRLCLVALLILALSPAGAQDCNQNGVPDDLDIQNGISVDCNLNGVPDECDIAGDVGFLETTFPTSAMRWELTVHAADLAGQPIDFDADGDGDADAVSFDFFDNSITVFLNNGNGGLAFQSALPHPDGPTYGTAGDFDGDGDHDVLVVSLDGTLCLHENLGGATFAPAACQPAGAFDNAWRVVAGDVDGDGDLDAVVSLTVADTVAVHLNEGDGSFADAVAYPVTEEVGQSLALGDLDGDGDLDLVVGSYLDHLTILLNNGIGAFNFQLGVALDDWPADLVVADLDGDGDRDIATAQANAGNVTVLLNDGFASFTESFLAAFDWEPFDLEAADFDGDGDLDLMVADRSFAAAEDEVWLLRNRGDAQGFLAIPYVTTIGSPPRSVSATDLDGDDRPDVLLGTDGGQSVSVLKNQRLAYSEDRNENTIPDECDSYPAFGYADPVSYAAGQAHEDLLAHDLNSDGHLDLVVVSTGTDEIGILFNQGDGTYEAGTLYDMGPGSDPSGVAAGDVSGDGHPDLVVATRGSTDARVLLNQGDGTFLAAPPIDMLEAQYGILAEDIDGDGHVDVAATNLMGGATVAWNLGSGSFDSIHYPAGKGAEGAIVAADLDGDALIDLAFTGSFYLHIYVLWNAGNRVFEPDGFPVSAVAHDIVPVDLSGDGALDLALALAVGPGPGLAVLENLGNRSFDWADQYLLGENPEALDAGDLDGDGDLDLASVDRFSNEITILPNIGGGALGTPVRFPAGSLGGGIDVADFNGDGILDIAASDATSVTVSLGDPLRAPIGDCNGNGIPDDCDIASGTSFDCNGNGIPDDCDLASGSSLDCNGNGVPDECDIADGTSVDCNANGVPDDCDLLSGSSLDCNGNGRPDECDIADGTSLDCNANDVPDECDIASGTSPDCNENEVPDECDIADGTSPDDNRNGIPDECEDPSGPEFQRGDANDDGSFDIADAIFVLAALFSNGPDPTCADAADSNDDGAMDIADAVYTLSTLFTGDTPPPAPHPDCGPDPTDDALECLQTSSCP